MKSKVTEGFTLVELSVALGVGSIVGVILLYALTQGVWLFRSNDSEMWSRDNGSSVIRAIRDDIQTAQNVRIYANYNNVVGNPGDKDPLYTDPGYGSCAVIDLPAGGSVTYYLAPDPSLVRGTVIPPAAGSKTTDNIYYHANGSTPLNRATDKQLAKGVQDFEFRRDLNGPVRVGFILDILGYHPGLADSHVLNGGDREADRVRFTTSAIPRNP